MGFSFSSGMLKTSNHTLLHFNSLLLWSAWKKGRITFQPVAFMLCMENKTNRFIVRFEETVETATQMWTYTLPTELSISYHTTHKMPESTKTYPKLKKAQINVVQPIKNQELLSWKLHCNQNQWWKYPAKCSKLFTKEHAIFSLPFHSKKSVSLWDFKIPIPKTKYLTSFHGRGAYLLCNQNLL